MSSHPNIKNIIYEDAQIRFELEDGILLGTFKVEYLDLEIVKKLVALRLNATKRKNYPMVANIISIKKITKEARDFLASEEGCEGIIAAAIIIDSPIGSMIGNFWIRINKPLRPTKLFTDESEAKNWLTDYI